MSNNALYSEITLDKLARMVLTRLGTTDDYVPSMRELYQHINSVRERLIRQDQQKGRFKSTSFIQMLGCGVELELISVEQVGCICPNQELTEEDCKNIKRSKDPIPKVIRLENEDALWVLNYMSLTGISYRKIDSWDFSKYRRFTGNSPVYDVIENYLYVKNAVGLSKVKIKGIFANPLMVGKFANCDNTCFDENSAYPISGDMVETIVDMVTNSVINNIRLQDGKNDGNKDVNAIQQTTPRN